MRIISQKGRPVIVDVEYEKVAISQLMTYPSKIIARNVLAADDKIILMAKYSTPDKSEKAMQKLHECYTGVLLMQNVSLPEEGAEQLKNMTTGFICINNREDNVKIEPMHTVFCFPQEDEI